MYVPTAVVRFLSHQEEWVDQRLIRGTIDAAAWDVKPCWKGAKTGDLFSFLQRDAEMSFRFIASTCIARLGDIGRSTTNQRTQGK
jgi:hypothetical protein